MPGRGGLRAFCAALLRGASTRRRRLDDVVELVARRDRRAEDARGDSRDVVGPERRLAAAAVDGRVHGRRELRLFVLGRLGLDEEGDVVLHQSWGRKGRERGGQELPGPRRGSGVLVASELLHQLAVDLYAQRVVRRPQSVVESFGGGGFGRRQLAVAAVSENVLEDHRRLLVQPLDRGEVRQPEVDGCLDVREHARGEAAARGSRLEERL
mmetsp:Transcript_12772/g.42671  ORF Transcript_12772/g.42671 Transcript_12772/m.42671 type:complete len:211 (+) Transcript_12772:157-789(+)